MTDSVTTPTEVDAERERQDSFVDALRNVRKSVVHLADLLDGENFGDACDEVVKTIVTVTAKLPALCSSADGWVRDMWPDSAAPEFSRGCDYVNKARQHFAAAAGMIEYIPA